MDARTKRTLRREAIREINYMKFLKQHTHNKNIAAREKRMLQRRVLRDEYMRKEELNKKDKMRKNKEKQENALVSIPISDLREILQAKKYIGITIYDDGYKNRAEFNYHMWKIEKICKKHMN